MEGVCVCECVVCVLLHDVWTVSCGEKVKDSYRNEFGQNLTIYSPVVNICTASLTFSNSTFCPTHCIYVFCVDLRTNSDYFPIQH